MKYKVILQTTKMKKKSKPIIVKLPSNEIPTPYNIISQILTEYYVEHREEMGFKINMDIARAVAYDTRELVDNLIYYEIKKIKE